MTNPFRLTKDTVSELDINSISRFHLCQCTMEVTYATKATEHETSLNTNRKINNLSAHSIAIFSTKINLILLYDLSKY